MTLPIAPSLEGKQYPHYAMELETYAAELRALLEAAPSDLINEYQEFTGTTAVYPDAGTGNPVEFMYIATGLAGEAGKVANLAKKLYRDNLTDIQKSDILLDMMGELGDAQWYGFRLCQVSGVLMEDVLLENRRKLEDRKERDVLHGRGSHR